MRILGISSATKVISIGLIDEDKVLVETTVSDIRAEKIILYVNEAGIKPEQIEGIAVAQGPGSYSGLRGGLAAAKSLAATLSVPLTGVSTLKAIAYNLVDIEGTMVVILDAKRDEYNFALFGAHQGKLKRLTDDLVLPIDKIMAKLSEITGEMYLVGNTAGVRDQGLGGRGNFHFAEEIHSHPFGINVARLGLLKITAGETEDPLKLTPKYSHKPNIREYKH
ncbi:MAG: tRNA (adenosine(37)-N6)-threonylcarbamoyltransferase complex dimerization subunit type 1 TsaB [Candidatus Margulisbacteria bacterium]|nr:tRNA (adenosine(37)-N6)-threonylcarbamoyltransferase complex dimerization subunit type 1 TsaB [Candidatus Margulisiibacteriota bacterium]